MTINQGFQCGHENPASNHFCGVCGAARLRGCRLCAAPIHGDAKYCDACGNRLDEANERTRREEGGESFREQEVVDWAAARRARYEGTPDPLADDLLDEEGVDEDRRRRPLAMVAVVAATLAVVVAVGYVAVSRHTVFLERMEDTRDVRASTPVTQQ